MDFVKFASLLFILASGSAWCDPLEIPPHPRQLAIEELERKSCTSSEEYIQALKYLRSKEEVMLPENAAREFADRISKGCTGASERFRKTLVLLKSVGLSNGKALEMALEFAAQSDQTHDNFMAIFSRAFLAEFLDTDYVTAVRLAYELSKDYKGDPIEVRKDFLELVRWCKDGDSLDLPIQLCSEYTIKLARLSQYFPDGVRAPFHKLYETLREKKPFELDVKTALDVAYNVLKNGPKGPENFFKGFEFAISKDGLNLEHARALEFGMRMASRSYVGSEPTVIPPVETGRDVAHAE